MVIAIPHQKQKMMNIEEEEGKKKRLNHGSALYLYQQMNEQFPSTHTHIDDDTYRTQRVSLVVHLGC